MLFLDYMRKLSKSDFTVNALRQSHADEKRCREDAITRLQDEQSKFRTGLIGSTMIGLTVYRTGLREVARVASDTEAIC